MIFQDAIVEFGFDCKVRKLSPRSIDNYQKQLRHLQNYLLEEYGIKNVEQVRTAHIKLFPAMLDDRQRKPCCQRCRIKNPQAPPSAGLTGFVCQRMPHFRVKP